MLPGNSTIKEFEALIGKHCNKEHAIATCNASVGILGVFHALGLAGKEIITAPFTWPGAISGLLMLNCKIKICEAEGDFYNIDPEKLEDLITIDTKAIFSSDFLGYPCRLDIISSICRKHNILLIHDGASSFGSYYQQNQAGYYADVAVYSFGKRKLFSVGEGGAIITNNEEIYLSLLKSLTHPERQNIESDCYNPFSLNTTINPLAAKYGLETYKEQLIRINERSKNVTGILRKLLPCTKIKSAVPNYYKIILPRHFDDSIRKKHFTNYSYYSLARELRCFSVVNNILVPENIAHKTEHTSLEEWRIIEFNEIAELQGIIQ